MLRKRMVHPLFTAQKAGGLEFTKTENGGAEEARTTDPHNAIVVLYQLSYDPNQGREYQVSFVMESKFFSF